MSSLRVPGSICLLLRVLLVVGYLTCLKQGGGWAGGGRSAVTQYPKGRGELCAGPPCVSWLCLSQVSSASWEGGQDSEWPGVKTHPRGQPLQPEGWGSEAGLAGPSGQPYGWRGRWAWLPPWIPLSRGNPFAGRLGIALLLAISITAGPLRAASISGHSAGCFFLYSKRNAHCRTFVKLELLKQR